MPTIYELRSKEKYPYYYEGLLDFITYIPDGSVMLEIGCYRGESARMFLESGKIKKLYCMDSWENDPSNKTSFFPDLSDVEKAFEKNLKEFPQVVKIKSFSRDGLKYLEDVVFDVIYIDGDHSYYAVRDDINMYMPKVKKGGILAGHDYCPNSEFIYDPPLEFEFPGVVQAVNEVLGSPDKIFVDTTWMKQL